MENLTPVQRVAVIAIGLALTLLVMMLVLPWAWKQISEWLPATERDSLGLVPVLLPSKPVVSAAPAVVGVRTWADVSSRVADSADHRRRRLEDMCVSDRDDAAMSAVWPDSGLCSCHARRIRSGLSVSSAMVPAGRDTCPVGRDADH